MKLIVACATFRQKYLWMRKLIIVNDLELYSGKKPQHRPSSSSLHSFNTCGYPEQIIKEYENVPSEYACLTCKVNLAKIYTNSKNCTNCTSGYIWIYIDADYTQWNIFKWPIKHSLAYTALLRCSWDKIFHESSLTRWRYT